MGDETYIRQRDEWDKEHSYDGPGFTLKLSYEAQLQENWFGLDDSNVRFRYVRMPNHHIMKYLKLYTAERGVVRDISTNEVVSINIKIGSLRGLAIRKKYLLKYLTNYGYALVYYSLGEKLVRIKNNYQILGMSYNLSGSYSYEDGHIKDIQPIHISETLPRTKKEG